MNWMVPLRKLGPDQTTVLDRMLRLDRGRIWIQGFAGSGKTTLLVHGVREALGRNPGLSACVVVYTHALRDLVATGLPEQFKQVPVMTYHQFLKGNRIYDLVLVDEVQDLPRDVIQQISSRAKRLIVAGDMDQSIYRDRASAQDIDQVLAPEKHALEIIYRLTQALRQIARTILPASRIETARVDRMLANVDIRLLHATDSAAELSWVWGQAVLCARQGDPAAILLPSRSHINDVISSICRIQGAPPPSFPRDQWGALDYHQVNQHLSKHAVPLRYLGSKFGSLTESDTMPLVYILTYHSAKGLDFESVFLPCLNSGTIFWRDNDDLARRLFFVAVTRSRRDLFMSYHSTHPHPFVQAMPRDLVREVQAGGPAGSGGENVDIF